MGPDLDPPRPAPDRPPSPYASLGSVELDDLLHDLGGLLGELGERAASASVAHARLGALLDAVVAVSSDLELTDVLSRITRAACSLAGARYGALGVLGPSGERLVEFITDGVTAAERAAIGDPPEGHGVLGLLIRDPRPRRLRDIREHEESFGFPPNHPPMRSFLGAPIRIRDEVFGNLYLAEKQGAEEFSAADESIVVALAAAAGVTIDNARLYDTSRRRALGSTAVGELTHALLEGRDETEALRAFALAVTGLAAAARTGIVLHDGAGMRYLAAVSSAAGEATTVAFDGEVWDAVEASREPLVLEATAAPDLATAPMRSIAAALDIDPTSPAAVLNLGSGDADVGLVLVAWDRSHGEPLLDVHELAELARHAGLALLAGRTRHAQSRMTLLEDRERIARDMHDHVIQRLFATGLSLQTAVQVSTDPAVRNRVDEAVDALDASIREIRMTIFELSQTRVDLSGEAQLRQVTSAFARGLGFAPDLVLDGPLEELPVTVRDDVTAVVREGLANVMRHARATEARVCVRVDDQVTVEVADDGVGTRPHQARSGLVNLAERAGARGGRFEILATPPRGTTLRWSVPPSDDAGPRSRSGPVGRGDQGRDPALTRPEGAAMMVDDILRQTVPSVREHTVLAVATDALVESGLGTLPVLDADGLLTGVVSEGDVLRFAVGTRRVPSSTARGHDVAYGHDAYRAVVADVMTRNPVTVTERQSVEDVARLLVRLPWRVLPVVQLGRLVGVVTRTDVVRALGRPHTGPPWQAEPTPPLAERPR